MAIGCFCALAGALLLPGALIGRVVAPELAVPGWVYASLLAIFLGGVQLIAIGVLGQYIRRVYEQTNERPLYIVAERANFDPAGEDARADG
jgi:dolichol-phosphate mannosyltransferase